MPPTLVALFAFTSFVGLAATLVIAARAFSHLARQLRELTTAVERLAQSPQAQVLLSAHGASPAEALEPTSPPALSVDELQARLLAAQEAGDMDGLLAFYDQLAPRLDPSERAPLDARLIRWFLDRLMKRMRGGTVGVDVATFASRIADRFPTTREGAALRASLPTLRRSAGLCAECAEPYIGDEAACPECMTRKVDPGPRTLPIGSTWPTDDESSPAALPPGL